MPGLADSDVGVLGREWWRRCQWQIGSALAIGALVGCLIGGGLAARQLSLETLTLWGKYQFARGAAAVGLGTLPITWPDERGSAVVAIEELLKTPGLSAWAEPIAQELGAAAAPALVGGFLAFVATLLWTATRATPEQAPDVLPNHVTTVSTGVEAPTAVVAEPSPVELPPTTQPTPAARPHPILQDPPPAPDFPPKTIAQEPPRPQPSSPPVLPAASPPAPPPQTAGKLGMSYEAYWGLAELPFENVPDPKFYFPTPMHEEALHRLLYGVQTRKGALMLTGEIGCGKTLLSRELSLHLSGQQYDVALIANPSFGVEDFLTEVLYQLGIEPTKTKVKLLHLLNERLLDNYKRGKQTVVVIDEAQTIPDDQIFEELRLLLNFQLNDRFLLTLVLMGQPELNDRVMALKQFAQRISIKYHLGYFTAPQTAEYIRFRLKAAKCHKEIFGADALDMLFKQSGGVPRNINTLCDLCLLIGFMDRATVIDGKIVERAAAERGELGLF